MSQIDEIRERWSRLQGQPPTNMVYIGNVSQEIQTLLQRDELTSVLLEDAEDQVNRLLDKNDALRKRVENLEKALREISDAPTHNMPGELQEIARIALEEN